MATDATLVKALQQLLFPGTAVEHRQLALRLRQIADTLIASDAEECGAIIAGHGCEVASADVGEPTPTHNGVEAACNGALAGVEDAEKQHSDVEGSLADLQALTQPWKGQEAGRYGELHKRKLSAWNKQRPLSNQGRRCKSTIPHGRLPSALRRAGGLLPRLGIPWLLPRRQAWRPQSRCPPGCSSTRQHLPCRALGSAWLTRRD